MAIRRILRIDDPNDYRVLKSRSQLVNLPQPALQPLLLSYAIQHEIDHLNGVLYTERILNLTTFQRYGPRLETSA